MTPSHLDWQDQRLLDVLSEFYDLGDCRIVSSRLGMWEDHVRWRIATSRKGHVFVKERPGFLSKDEFPLHLNVYQHLQQGANLVVPLLIGVDGGAYCTCRDRSFAVYEWTDARPASLDSQADMELFGELTGRLLLGLSTYGGSPEARNWRYPQNRAFFGPDTSYEILCFVNLLENALDHSRQSMYLLDQLRSFIHSNASPIHAGTLPEGFVHGDFQPFNCLIGPNRAWVIDFDRLHWSYRIADLTYACALAAGMESRPLPPYAHIRPNWKRENAECMLAGFGRYVNLEAAEDELFPKLLCLQLIRNFIGGLDLDIDETETRPADLQQQTSILLTMLTDIVHHGYI